MAVEIVIPTMLTTSFKNKPANRLPIKRLLQIYLKPIRLSCKYLGFDGRFLCRSLHGFNNEN